MSIYSQNKYHKTYVLIPVIFLVLNANQKAMKRVKNI